MAKNKEPGFPVGKRQPKADGSGYEDGKDYQADGWEEKSTGTYNRPYKPLPEGVEGFSAGRTNQTPDKTA